MNNSLHSEILLSKFIELMKVGVFDYKPYGSYGKADVMKVVAKYLLTSPRSDNVK